MERPNLPARNYQSSHPRRSSRCCSRKPRGAGVTDRRVVIVNRLCYRYIPLRTSTARWRASLHSDNLSVRFFVGRRRQRCGSDLVTYQQLGTGSDPFSHSCHSPLSSGVSPRRRGALIKLALFFSLVCSCVASASGAAGQAPPIPHYSPPANDDDDDETPGQWWRCEKRIRNDDVNARLLSSTACHIVGVTRSADEVRNEPRAARRRPRAS